MTRNRIHLAGDIQISVEIAPAGSGTLPLWSFSLWSLDLPVQYAAMSGCPASFQHVDSSIQALSSSDIPIAHPFRPFAVGLSPYFYLTCHCGKRFHQQGLDTGSGAVTVRLSVSTVDLRGFQCTLQHNSLLPNSQLGVSLSHAVYRGMPYARPFRLPATVGFAPSCEG